MKTITEDLIQKRLEQKGFFHIPNMADMIKTVETHYNVNFTDDPDQGDASIDEEHTADGYIVYVVKRDIDRQDWSWRNVCVGDSVYYYDTSLQDELNEMIEDESVESIFIYDMYAYWFEDTIRSSYDYLEERTREGVIDELYDEGYEWYDNRLLT